MPSEQIVTIRRPSVTFNVPREPSARYLRLGNQLAQFAALGRLLVDRKARFNPEAVWRSNGIAIGNDKMKSRFRQIPTLGQLRRHRHKRGTTRQLSKESCRVALFQCVEIGNGPWTRLRHGLHTEIRRRLAVEVRRVLNVYLIVVVQRLVRMIAALFQDQRVGGVEAFDVLANNGLEIRDHHLGLRRFERVLMGAVDKRMLVVVIAHV